MQVESKSLLLTWVNDTRACPHVTMATQPPALTCACGTCDVVGWHLPQLDSTVYVYGLRILSEFNDREARTLRAEWKRSMRQIPNAQTMETGPLRYRDAKFRRDAGEATEFAKTMNNGAAVTRAVQAGGYHGTGRLLYMSGSMGTRDPSCYRLLHCVRRSNGCHQAMQSRSNAHHQRQHENGLGSRFGCGCMGVNS
jgi:hypothetical protein